MKWVIIINGQYVKAPMDFEEAKSWEKYLAKKFPGDQVGMVSWD